jgi:hypothetical protein
VPLFPSITTGPDEVSELADPDGVGVGDFVLVAVGAGVGEGLVSLGAALGSFVALGELLVAGIVVALGELLVAGIVVALGELLVAGIVVALGAGAVLGFDVGICVVDGAVADGVAVVDVVGEAAGVAVADGVAVVDVVGEAVGVAVAPLLATVKYPRRLDLVPSDRVSTTLRRCDPSASFVVSYGTAAPSSAVPARSKGGSVSDRTRSVLRRPSR